jgi:acyl-CoA synthetase (AMP-forming)/AMP-acid ligase II
MKEFLDALDANVVTLTAPGEDLEVIEQPIDGQLYRVYRNAGPTLREYLEPLNQHRDETFLVYQDERYTFAQTYQLSTQLAQALVQDFGIQKGDRVAIAMRNNPQWCFAFMAIVSIGAIAVPMNAWWTSEELQYGFADSGAALVICDPQRCDRIKPFASQLQLTQLVVGNVDDRIAGEVDFETILKKHQGATMPNVKIAPEDCATILYTSGSTGMPKGVVSSHRSVLSALYSWLTGSYAAVATVEQLAPELAAPALEQQAAVLLTIPLFHVTASHSIFLLSIIVGRKMVIMYKWDAEIAMELIEHEKISSFSGVPTMSAELEKAALTTERDLSTLREVNAGGASRPPEQVRKLATTFASAKAGLGYGLTETNGIGAITSGVFYQLKPHSCGRVLPAVTEIKIINESGQTLGVGETGEVCIYTPGNAKGYWNKKEATAEVFVDGWFRTGDVGKIDEEGFLTIIDRIKDIIIRGGENISCIEVESAIYEHPKVSEVAVFGVPDPRLGETVGAVVVPNTGEKITTKELHDFLADKIASFKIPAHCWIEKQQLPRIATGKIYKKGLKADYAAKLELA